MNFEDYRRVARAGKVGYEGTLRARPVRVGEVAFGGDSPVVVAGPCAVESREQTLRVARAVREAGADALRGGAYKPRTSPYSFQGLGREGLEILREAKEETGLPVVTEVMDVRLLESVCEVADMLQVGSRNMQNFALLSEVGRAGLPVLLKRGMSASLKEWLCAAEYVALAGNLDVVLCERGVRCPVSGDYSRNTLDLTVIIPARQETILPVIADPSHASGRADLVPWISKGAVAAGAQGLIIEVIDEDDGAAGDRCDAHQSVTPAVLREIVEHVKSAPAARTRCP